MSDFLIAMKRNRDDIDEPRLPFGKAESPRFLVTENLIEIRQKGFNIFAQFAKGRTDNIYAEMVDGRYTGSFVLALGWSYLVTADDPSLSRADLILFLKMHRSETCPSWLNGNILSGQFCMLSFDHHSQSLWCTCDMWAQHGFYFGSDSGLVAASSHAGRIANLLNSQINGYAYLARVRGTALPPGQTLFANVCRITCGNAIRFDFSRQIAWVVKTSEIVRPIENLNFQESIERCIDVLLRVCLRAVKLRRMAIDLTGGNDTRLSAATLAFLGESAQASRHTFKVHQTDTHADAIIAGKIANEFGWTLRRCERGFDISSEPVDLLLRIAQISDGNRFPADLAMGILRGQASWLDCDFLWGSLGGELMRDFFWRHEMYLMGLTNKVNYHALLHHRLYTSSTVDVERISDTKLSLEDHDEYILSAYQFFGEMNPCQKNVYKLDRIYLAKLMFSANNWEYSEQHTKVFPFLTSEVLNVSLSVPWVHRVGRRLVKAIIEKLQPSLADIPHDTGAPMAPLRISNILGYTRYSCSYLYGGLSRHFLKNKHASVPPIPINTPKNWLMWGIDRGNEPLLSSSRHILKNAAEGIALRFEDAREVEMLLLVKALKEIYPNISEELAFGFTETKSIMTESQL